MKKKNFIPICPLCGGETDNCRAKKHNCASGKVYRFQNVMYKDEDGNLYFGPKKNPHLCYREVKS